MRQSARSSEKEKNVDTEKLRASQKAAIIAGWPFCEDGCGEVSEVMEIGPTGEKQYRCLPCFTRS